MAGEKKEATGWQFKLVAVLLSIAVVVGIFGVSFSAAGNEMRAGTQAAIPLIAAWLSAFVLGKIKPLRDNKWQIYVVVLLVAAVVMLLRIYRIL